MPAMISFLGYTLPRQNGFKDMGQTVKDRRQNRIFNRTNLSGTMPGTKAVFPIGMPICPGLFIFSCPLRPQPLPLSVGRVIRIT